MDVCQELLHFINFKSYKFFFQVGRLLKVSLMKRCTAVFSVTFLFRAVAYYNFCTFCNTQIMQSKTSLYAFMITECISECYYLRKIEK